MFWQKTMIRSMIGYIKHTTMTHGIKTHMTNTKIYIVNGPKIHAYYAQLRHWDDFWTTNMRMFEHTNSVPRDNDAQTRGRTLNIYDGKNSWAQTHVSIDSMKIDVLTQNGDTGYYPLTKACRKLTNIYIYIYIVSALKTTRQWRTEFKFAITN